MTIAFFVVLVALTLFCFFDSFASRSFYEKAFYALVGLVLIKLICIMLGV